MNSAVTYVRILLGEERPGGAVSRQSDLGSNPCTATNWLCDPGQIASCLCFLVTEHSVYMMSKILSTSNGLFVLCHLWVKFQ